MNVTEQSIPAYLALHRQRDPFEKMTEAVQAYKEIGREFEPTLIGTDGKPLHDDRLPRGEAAYQILQHLLGKAAGIAIRTRNLTVVRGVSNRDWNDRGPHFIEADGTHVYLFRTARYTGRAILKKPFGSFTIQAHGDEWGLPNFLPVPPTRFASWITAPSIMRGIPGIPVELEMRLAKARAAAEVKA